MAKRKIETAHLLIETAHLSTDVFIYIYIYIHIYRSIIHIIYLYHIEHIYIHIIYIQNIYFDCSYLVVVVVAICGYAY